MKWIKRILGIIILLYVIALLLDIFISKSLLKSNLFEGELETWNDIQNKNLSEDLLIYGSSRSYVHINPNILDEKLEINSYNLGFNGQLIKLQKFRHQELLNNNFLPKNVLINLDIVCLSEINEIYNSEQFIPLMLFDKKVFNLIKKDLDLKTLDFYIPLIRYRTFKYKKIALLKEIYKIYFFSDYKKTRNKGYQGIDRIWKDSENLDYDIEIDSLRKQDLINIIEDLQKINSNVILINSPEYINQIKSQKNRDEILNLYKKIANQYKIPFLDYTNDSINYKKELFYNSNHLNAKGADIFTEKLSKDIAPYIKK